METPTAKVAKKSNRGSKPGEHRGGRAKGVLNKATATIRDAAQQYTEEALATLVDVMRDTAAPHAARNVAANSLLDRAHGKPSQAVDATVTGDIIARVIFKGLND